MAGPLTGVTVLEFAGLGPAPFCAMLLSDMGAEVVRIDRKGRGAVPFDIDYSRDVTGRGRRSIGIDLKSPAGVATCLRLIERADVVIEGFRPGVMERMGLGPEQCLARQPALVYGRMTGWGQDGPLAQSAGHDINYIGLAGALEMMGRKGERPFPPLNLVGDMGGGGMYLAFGVACALLEARSSGKGQVIDAAIVDGTALLLSQMFAMKAWGMWNAERGTNVADTGAHFYETYETADGGFVAVGAVEPQFYAQLCHHARLDPDVFGKQHDVRCWPDQKEQLAGVFRMKTRDEWEEIFGQVDACVSPVLTPEEAADHPHNAARGVFVVQDNLLQPAPGPRFSRTPGAIQGPPPRPGEHSAEVLADWGFDETDVTDLQAAGVI